MSAQLAAHAHSPPAVRVANRSMAATKTVIHHPQSISTHQSSRMHASYGSQRRLGVTYAPILRQPLRRGPGVMQHTDARVRPVSRLTSRSTARAVACSDSRWHELGCSALRSMCATRTVFDGYCCSHCGFRVMAPTTVAINTAGGLLYTQGTTYALRCVVITSGRVRGKRRSGSTGHSRKDGNRHREHPHG